MYDVYDFLKNFPFSVFIRQVNTNFPACHYQNNFFYFGFWFYIVWLFDRGTYRANGPGVFHSFGWRRRTTGNEDCPPCWRSRSPLYNEGCKAAVWCHGDIIAYETTTSKSKSSRATLVFKTKQPTCFQIACLCLLIEPVNHHQATVTCCHSLTISVVSVVFSITSWKISNIIYIMYLFRPKSRSSPWRHRKCNCWSTSSTKYQVPFGSQTFLEFFTGKMPFSLTIPWVPYKSFPSPFDHILCIEQPLTTCFSSKILHSKLSLFVNDVRNQCFPAVF